MKALIVIVVTIFFASPNLKGQADLTKEEIINDWKSSTARIPIKKDFTNVFFDKKSKKRINSIIDSLTQIRTDSIMIYSVSYPGYRITHSCFNDLYPVYLYIIWASHGKLNMKLLKGACEFSAAKIDSSGLFAFYTNNKVIIEKEVVMPVILEAKRNKNNEISYTSTSVNHEPKYLLHTKTGKDFKLMNFTQNDLENEKSLFHDYNKSLKSIQLWNLIKIEIMKSFPLEGR